MASLTITNTFTNGTTADATQVNTNFQDVVNGTSDGTIDFSIAALTVAGTLTANGNVTLGNGGADDITILGSLASSIAIKLDSTYDIGTSSKGINALYFGQNSQRVGITGSSSMSATYTITLPVNAGVAGQSMINDGSAVMSWVPGQMATSAKSADYTITDIDKVRTILMTTGSSTDKTVTLPTAADNTNRIITIKKVDSGTNDCIVDGEGAETIDGSTTVNLTKQYNSITVQSNGTGWIIEGSLKTYAEGTWTGTLIGSTGGTGTVKTGTYTKIGRLVNVSIEFDSVNNIGNTGIIEVTGLPFTVNGYNHFGSAWLFNLGASTTADVSPYANDGETYIRFLANSAGSSITWSSPGSAEYVRLTMQYEAA